MDPKKSSHPEKKTKKARPCDGFSSFKPERLLLIFSRLWIQSRTFQHPRGHAHRQVPAGRFLGAPKEPFLSICWAKGARSRPEKKLW